MKILGIGNAIVDVICKVKDSFLSDKMKFIEIADDFLKFIKRAG